MSDNKEKEICGAEEEAVTNVRISDEVVATIAAIAAVEIEGVGGMCGTRTGDIIEKFGKKNSAKGVKVDIADGSVRIHMNLLVVYGYRIPDVCAEVQEAAKTAVEGMTGLHVSEITVLVQGITAAKEGDAGEEA